MRRAVSVLTLAGAWLVFLAGPAAADPAGPTHYDSRVQAVESADGQRVGELEAEVLGGDAFLVLRAAPGTEVEVPGYDEEPYLRFSPDGTVEVNHRAPTHWVNEDRYGAEVPPVADEEAEPVWRVVADGGEYAWHEHRIHWMSPSAPRHVDTGAGRVQEVFDWEIPVLVDGQAAHVRGTLSWHPGPPWWVAAVLPLAALGLAAGALFVLRVPAGAVALVAAVPTGAVGVAQNVGLPPGGDGDPFLALLPAVAAVIAVLGLVLGRRGRGDARGVLLGGAAGIPLLVWGVLQAGALTRPITPEPVTTGWIRVVAALALGAGAAALAVLAWRARGTLAGSWPAVDAPGREVTAADGG